MTQKKSTRRDQIEAAALRLFAERGIAEVSVRDIAQAADVGESGLYRHMKSKEELATRVFVAAYADLALEFTESLIGKHTFADQIDALIGVVLSAFDRDPVLLRFLLMRQHDSLGAVGYGEHNPVDVLSQVVASAIERGEIRFTEADLATAIMMGIVLQPLTFSLYGRMHGNTADLKAPLCAAILRALKAEIAQ